MRVWYDFEFLENGRIIQVVSLGMVAADGREYYAQSVEFDAAEANPFVVDHVFPALSCCETHSHGDAIRSQGYHQVTKGRCPDGIAGNVVCPWRTQAQIADEVLAFCDPDKYGKAELWAYYAAFDHVALAWLYGPMADMPPSLPQHTLDVKQWAVALGNPRLPRQSAGLHNALADARHVKKMWEFLAARDPSLALPSRAVESSVAE